MNEMKKGGGGRTILLLQRCSIEQKITDLFFFLLSSRGSSDLPPGPHTKTTVAGSLAALHASLSSPSRRPRLHLFCLDLKAAAAVAEDTSAPHVYMYEEQHQNP